MVGRVLFGTCVLCCCAVAQVNIEPRLRPRNQPETAVPPPLARVDISLVLIPAHVTTLRGQPITNLKKENFHLYENNVEQTITHFMREDAPVSVGVLFDKSGSMKNRAERSRQALTAFFRTSNPEDEFFLVEFNDRARLAVPFTRDTRKVLEEVSRIKPSGMTSLLDALRLSLTAMKGARYSRKAIVILSDGGDNWSRHSLREVRAALVEADVQIYAMGVFDGEPAKRPVEERRGPELLGGLAAETGGTELAVHDPSELQEISERVSTALRTEYILGYSPANEDRDGMFRRVRLQVAAPEVSTQLHVEYRQGYYAPAH